MEPDDMPFLQLLRRLLSLIPQLSQIMDRCIAIEQRRASYRCQQRKMFKVNREVLGKFRRFPGERKTTGDKQKGPSKEERKSPVSGQTLLPDANLAQERWIRPLIGPIRVPG
ncbi:MAG: hypothetical protein SPF89_00005 [Sphaerochaetaceae bacterium]|nr:hypothetical protein [Spirochaetales bacterium]MDY5498467.1 hypothetical protein [Sphaerochaetaceae bacterium]